ncbi:MAG: hypothetical protein ACI9WU_004389 [Myxococcota bacterium]|jgi:hypothetical protein
MSKLYVGAILLALAACGPTWTHQPLVGEDADITSVLGYDHVNLETPETVQAAERFYRELWSERTTDLWNMLSTDTRSALDALAGKLDSNGRAMLRARQFPRADGTKVRVSLAALFMVRRPTVFEAETKPAADATNAVVTVRNRDGKSRRVQLRRERGAWKLHHPAFDNLPAARDLRPSLLPTTMPKKPAPAADTPTPATEPDADADDNDNEDDDIDDNDTDADDEPTPGDNGSGAPAPRPDLDF